MADQVLTLFAGLVLVFVGHQLSRGGLWLRGLSDARHELEVAALLEHDDALATQLRDRARGRIERYLEQTTPERTWRRWQLVNGLTLIGVGIATTGLVLWAYGPRMLPVMAGAFGIGIIWSFIDSRRAKTGAAAT